MCASDDGEDALLGWMDEFVELGAERGTHGETGLPWYCGSCGKALAEGEKPCGACGASFRSSFGRVAPDGDG